MSATCLVVHFAAGFGHPLRTQFMFADTTSAAAVFEQLKVAVQSYHNRANDRERIASFAHVCGEAAVDVSQIAAIEYESPLGEARPVYEEWERGLGEIKAVGKIAGATDKRAPADA